MSISQEEFEAAVQAAKKDLLMDVTVSGFEVHVAKKSRSGRSRYTLTAVYDPASDSWSGVDPYHGGTLPSLVRDIRRAMKQALLADEPLGEITAEQIEAARRDPRVIELHAKADRHRAELRKTRK